MPTITAKVDIDQYALITSAAREMGVSISEYLRYASLQSANMNLVLSRLDDIEARQAKLLDRDTMKGVLEYLNKTMPKLVHDYFQAQRNARG